MKFAITAAAIALGLAVAFSVTFYYGPTAPASNPGQGDTPAPQSQSETAVDNNAPAPDSQTPQDPAPADPQTTAANNGGTDSAADDTAPPTASFSNLRPAFGDESVEPVAIGSKDPESNFELLAEVDPYRAGLLKVTLSHYAASVDNPKRYVLLDSIDLNGPDQDTLPKIGSYAARQIIINGQSVDLFAKTEDNAYHGAWNIVSQSESRVKLALLIQAGPEDAPIDVVRITRTFSVQPESYTLSLNQQIENLTADQNLSITWAQLGPGDVHHNPSDYLRGRSRQYVLGYFDDDRDKSRFSIYTEDGFIARPDFVNNRMDAKGGKKDWITLWPNPKIDTTEKTLAWFAVENRYFAVITSAAIDDGTTESADITPLEDIFPKLETSITPGKQVDVDVDARKVLTFLTSKEISLKPGELTADKALDLDIYVGPRLDEIYTRAPYDAMRLDKTIRYSLGGFCGFCTFQWLAHGLLGFMKLIHLVFSDWGVAIIILVLVVRLVLHPLTKRGQTNMMKMGKQMQAVQPEMEKLKKKFADDPRGMQQAQMQLFREKGINPAASAVGCLPMFLQMPIWIALYAMLYYAIELRQESAFYGMFQAISGGAWPFLADLSVSDRFIPLFVDDGTHVLEVIFIRFDYSAINLLPLLMGITFYFNMKFTSPPPANEQQAQQQKIMRIMPFLMPIFLYSAPSGLTLYICASTFAGIVDSYIVRKHVKELEESGELFKKKEPKKGGFMEKLNKMAERAQERQAEIQKQQKQDRGPQNKKRKRK